MGNEQTKEDIQKPIPSPGPLKNEPTPERAEEEKQRQESAGNDSPKRDKPAG